VAKGTTTGFTAGKILTFLMKDASKLTKLSTEGALGASGGILWFLLINRYKCIISAISGAFIFVLGISQYAEGLPSSK
jgi:hypothetical protein